MIPFHKMQGAGNDFVVIDNRSLELSMDQIIAITPRLCDRRFGIGADGTLVLQKSGVADYTMTYRNADGSDAGMCGNGGRCLAKFAVLKGFPPLHTFTVHDHIYEASVHDQGVSIKFPVEVTPIPLGRLGGYELLQVDAATEHVVIVVDEPALEQEEELRRSGRIIRSSQKAFPKGTNVNFMSVRANDHLGLQTYERGVENLTLACGTGAIASSIAHHYLQGLRNEKAGMKVDCKGGRLTVDFEFQPSRNIYHHIYLSGPADFVFEGTISR
ncbi:MAG: diaminopimelate epimerase [Balneolales bacterium]